MKALKQTHEPDSFFFPSFKFFVPDIYSLSAFGQGP